MKKTFLLAIALLLSAATTYSSELDALNGTYQYLAADKNFEIKRFSLSIKNGTLDLPTNGPLLNGFAISEGAQGDFLATIKNPIQAGMSFYKFEGKLKASEPLTKVTIVRQTFNESQPRLSFFVLEKGRLVPIIRAYDSTQEAALKAEEAR